MVYIVRLLKQNSPIDKLYMQYRNDTPQILKLENSLMFNHGASIRLWYVLHLSYVCYTQYVQATYLDHIRKKAGICRM